MNKNRLEALSDGVFAIVFTLLILEIHVPEGQITNIELWGALRDLWPVLLSYMLSFFVLVAFWLGHHALFHFFVKTVNRQLVLLNMLFLMLVVFVPFSTQLLGTHINNQPAVIVYGLNIAAIAFVNFISLLYVLYSPKIEVGSITPRVIKQAKIRISLYLIFELLGVSVSFFSMPLSIFLCAFPSVFNLIPGLLDFTERTFKLNFE